jgi:hypothetical protein
MPKFFLANYVRVLEEVPSQYNKENPALPSLGESKVVGCTYAARKYATKLYFLTSIKKT